MVQIFWGLNSGLPLAGLSLLNLDACLSQEDEYKNKVTSYPVENGLDISDHIRQEPDECKIEGIVSDTPDDYFTLDGPRAASAYKALCAIAGRDFISKEGQQIKNEYPAPIMVDVISKYRVFTDMFLETLQVPHTPITGDSTIFTAHFKKIRKAAVNLAVVNYTSARIGGQDGVDRGQPDLGMGKQQTAQITASLGSLFSSLTAQFGAWFNGEQPIPAQ